MPHAGSGTRTCRRFRTVFRRPHSGSDAPSSPTGCEIGPTPFVEQALDTPNLCERWMPGPAPEPVAAGYRQPRPSLRLSAFVYRASAPNWRLHRLSRPAPAAAAPAPEPVAAFVRVQRRTESAATRASSLRMPAGTQLEHIQNATLAACHLGCREPQWLPRQHRRKLPDRRPPSARKPLLPRRCPRRNSQPSWHPPLDELLEPPAMCQHWMPAPGADPVFSYLRASSAPAINLTPALVLPAFCLSAPTPSCPGSAGRKPYRPRKPSWRPSGQVGQMRRGADSPEPGQFSARICAHSRREAPSRHSAACAPPPAAVESWLAAALVAVPLSIKHTALTGAELAEPPCGRSTRAGDLPTGGRSRPSRPGILPGAFGGRRHRARHRAAPAALRDVGLAGTCGADLRCAFPESGSHQTHAQTRSDCRRSNRSPHWR